MLRNVLLIDVAFAYSFPYSIDEVLAKFSYVRLAFQLNKVPEPIGEAALQVPTKRGTIRARRFGQLPWRDLLSPIPFRASHVASFE
jgi:hypothetical protein